MKASKALVLLQLLVCLHTSTTTSSTDEKKVIKIPLQKRYKPSSSKHAVPLRDRNDILYLGEVLIGTPPQRLWVVYDTGSVDLWVCSSHVCEESPQNCTGSNHIFKSHKSQTYKENGREFAIQYGTGFVSGIVSEDVVEIGGVKLQKQLFGEAKSITEEFKDEELGLFGILGLGLPYTEQVISRHGVDEIHPIFIKMVHQGLIHEPVFAFYMNSKNDHPSHHGSAELVLGGVDTDHYTGDFTFTPVIQDVILPAWYIQVNGIYINDKLISAPALNMVVDSGTTFCLLPAETLEVIVYRTYGHQVGDAVIVDCNKLHSFPEITIVIAGTNFVLTPEDYIIKEAEDKCTLGFSSAPENDNIPPILGDVFMRKFYTQFDYGNMRLGFAKAK